MSDDGSRPARISVGGVRIVGAIAGIGSGLTKVAVGHGFDTIKTRLQCSPPGTYRGTLDALTQTVRREGVLALYKGATPPAVGWAAIDAVLLGALHNYRLRLMRWRSATEAVPGADAGTRRLSLLAHGAAGLLAGLTSAVVATPMELLKVKLQMQRERTAAARQYKGPVDCARQLVRVGGGARALWTGLSGSLAFRANFFWMFAAFEALMRGFARLRGTPFEVSTGAANFWSGGLGSLAFWVMAIPADNVKNRMMSYAPVPPSMPRPSFLAVARQIHAHSGVRGFYCGLTVCLIRAFPSNACALFVYEGLMRGLGAEKTRH